MWKNGTVNDDADEDDDDDDDGLLSIILIFASLTTVVVGSSISVSFDCFELFISSVVAVCVQQTKVFNRPISSVLNKSQKPTYGYDCLVARRFIRHGNAIVIGDNYCFLLLLLFVRFYICMGLQGDLVNAVFEAPFGCS